MSKLTIKHFLNKKLKPIVIGENCEYPVYVQIVHKRHVQQIKSLLLGYMDEISFERKKTHYLIHRETELIERLYEYAESIISDFDIRKMSVTTRELLEWYTKPLNSIITEESPYKKLTDFIEMISTLTEKKTGSKINFDILFDWENTMAFLETNKTELAKIGIMADEIIEEKPKDVFIRFGNEILWGIRNNDYDTDIAENAMEYDKIFDNVNKKTRGSDEWKTAVLEAEKLRFKYYPDWIVDNIIHCPNVFNFQNDKETEKYCTDNEVDKKEIEVIIKRNFCKMIKK
ncbi:MAG: hypothetical protein IJP80_05895 [Bacteroidales bacterium]|nr:hypothetical protein [Bacteroidales bacterium]